MKKEKPVEQTTLLLPAEATDLRKVACAMAAATAESIVAEFFRGIDADDHVEPGNVHMDWDPNHPGDAPIKLDASAKRVAHREGTSRLKKLGYPTDEVVFGGEEGGYGTQSVSSGNLIVRQDVLDGSKNALRVMNEFATVHLLDKSRSVNPPRTRHYAGAILAANGFEVSWQNHSRFADQNLWYPRFDCEVYVAAAGWGQPSRRVRGLSYTRDPGTVAAVAHKTDKKDKLDQLLAQLGVQPKSVFTVAGTPLVSGLLAGEIGMIVETEPVTLHDSALLIPFQMLGGYVTDLNCQRLNYLKIYEQNAHILRADHKPIPGYIAWSDTTLLAQARANIAARRGTGQ